jgi:hypothetical protein
VLRLGRSIKIPTAPLLLLLGQPLGPPPVSASAVTPQTARDRTGTLDAAMVQAGAGVDGVVSKRLTARARRRGYVKQPSAALLQLLIVRASAPPAKPSPRSPEARA